MTLLPSEERILTSNDDIIILTNQRIQMLEKSWGHSYVITIFLEDISSIEKRYKSDIFLLILGGFLLLGSYFVHLQDNNSFENLWGLLLFIGILAVIFWAWSRKHIVRISSNGGGALNLEIKKMKSLVVEEFIDKISLVKGERIAKLYKL